jgi:hypothetical protein
MRLPISCDRTLKSRYLRKDYGVWLCSVKTKQSSTGEGINAFARHEGERERKETKGHLETG